LDQFHTLIWVDGLARRDLRLAVFAYQSGRWTKPYITAARYPGLSFVERKAKLLDTMK
jgi:hypothetical protein